MEDTKHDIETNKNDGFSPESSNATDSIPVKKEKSELQKRKIGALWVHDGKNGKFLGGELEFDGKKTRIVIFKNRSKKEEKYPDYEIFLDRKEVAKDIL